MRLLLTSSLLGPAAWAQSGTAQANGLTLAYESVGNPRHETILLISGTGGQLTQWPDALVQALVAQGYRVVRYDQRDSGLSTRFEGAGLPDWAKVMAALQGGPPARLAYTLNDMARDAVGLLDALHVRRAHLVGASMGGMIAQLVATDHPDRVLSLTSLMATDGKPGLPPVAKPEVMAQAPPAPTNPADTAAALAYNFRIRQLLGSPAYPTAEATLRAQVAREVHRAYYPAGYQRQGAAALVESQHDRRTELQALRVPTLVVHGDADPLVPVAAGQDVAVSIPGAEWLLLPGVGHELPSELAPLLAEAIGRVAKRGHSK
ncbi:alpha/beta hydrolase [Siccationidurans soli]|uniref:Alpha/beta hydrolase n=1 Tax=Hymenobacter negativus TaxID=2795026 RepID=A0ABS3QLS3_9BACT|nr:alpha/beta hydrolase [Hymenobacter negativus]